jgi:uncharacterized protein DUF1707
MTDPPDPQLPELRASDADREHAVEALRRGASEGRLSVDELEERITTAYAARTRNELERLIADVSLEPLGQDRAPATPVKGGNLTVKEGPGGDRWVISVMGGHDKKGRWRVAPRCTVLNVMGGSDIDLNDAELAQPVTELNMCSIMGGGSIWVPHGVDVHVSNFAFMGGNGVELGDEAAPPGAPVIRIRVVSIMGGSDVKRGRKPSRAERKRQRELKKSGGRGLER